MKDRLSDRELDVGRFLVQGASNKEIARALGIEVVTVKRHVGNVLRKLGARNRTQAAVKLSAAPGIHDASMGIASASSTDAAAVPSPPLKARK